MNDRVENDTIVIIPAYNEENSIHHVVRSIKQAYESFDVLVINDGSHDKTSEYAASAGAIVLNHPFNLGYGVAIQTGYKYASKKRYKYLVQMDGDGQHDAKEVQKLLDALHQDSTEIVLGSRYMGLSTYKTTVYRRMGTLFFRFLIKLFTRKYYSDPTTGFQAMKRPVIELFSQDSFPFDYPDADVIIILNKLGVEVKETPINMHSKLNGNSMHKNPIDIAYYIFKMILSVVLTALRKY